MDFDYDVAIIGAGPIGSTLAYKLAKEDLNVCLIDKKSVVGLPLQCAGIISCKIFDLNELPDDVILNRVRGANIYSASYDLSVFRDDYQAVVIDRVSYDQFLFNRACDAGVDSYLASKVSDVDIDEGIVYFGDLSSIRAKIIVGADGPNSVVSSKFNNDFNYFNASQYLVKVKCIDDMDLVNVFARSIFPGFIWAIPTYNNIFRVGMFSNHSYKEQSKILDNFLDDGFQRISHDNCVGEKYDYTVLERYIGKIPIFNGDNCLSKSRAILIGDAASQVKPTTGGGLIMGFNCCEIAKDNICNALKNDDITLLSNYSDDFLDKYLNEFSYQFKVQESLSLLSDDDIDYFFNKLKEKNCEELISKYGDMDNQSVLVKQFIKRGLVLSVLPKLFKKELLKIWF
ncbi:MAG: NAD(P)/FAD-dependent oxidoreductase [Methanobacteriaceae archaeon]|nr:NAD(P)/FAD-dependent oxidoreductase [Methanobacteriaceae archaeon]